MATEFTHSTLERRFTGMISVCCCIVERKRGLPLKTSNSLTLDAVTANLAESGRLNESSPSLPRALP